MNDKKTDIVMFVMNDVLNDPRVQREARSASEDHFRVRVIGLQSARCRIEQETRDGYELIRVTSGTRRVTRGLLTLLQKLASLRSYVRTAAHLALTLTPNQSGTSLSRPRRLTRRVKDGLKWIILIIFFPVRLIRSWMGFGQSTRAPVSPSNPSGIGQYLQDLMFFEDIFWTSMAMMWAAGWRRHVVFHGNDLPTLPLITWAGWLSAGKTVYDSHELWVGQSTTTSRFFNAVSRWIEDRYIRRVDAVVTVNQFIAEELRNRYRIPLPTVVMNCPGYVSSPPQKFSYSIRGRLGLPSSVPLILYQGLYMPGRGLEALMESARYLRKGVIVLRGYGANENSLRDLALSLQETGRVFMVEPVPMTDLIDAAREADIGVVPYTACTPCNYYSSPNKLFEYLMAGLALAVSDLPFLRAVVEKNNVGVIFDPASPRHIAKQLDSLIDDPTRLSTCKANASRLARERYNWAHEGRKLITLYEELSTGTVRQYRPEPSTSSQHSQAES